MGKAHRTGCTRFPCVAITAGWDRERTARNAIKQRFPAFHPPRAPDAVDAMATEFANIGTPP